MDFSWLSTNKLENIKKITNIPPFGYRVRCDVIHENICKPFTVPRLHHIFKFITFTYRYICKWLYKYMYGKVLFIDNLNLVQWKPIYGAPLGGIGSGIIGRGYKGEFCRFQMIPGMYQHDIVYADQFLVTIRRYGETVYQKVLCCSRPQPHLLNNWDWSFSSRHCWYHALYPRAWSIYDIPEYQVILVCRQVSPVIPQDYKDSSFPGGVFVWEIYNECSDDQEISITFTFRNGQGSTRETHAQAKTEVFTWPLSTDNKPTKNLARNMNSTMKGVNIHQTFRDMPCTYAIASRDTEEVDVSYTSQFNPVASGEPIWAKLHSDGSLDNNDSKMTGSDVGCAVCAKMRVKGHSKAQCEFTLVWHMPRITFGNKVKYYTRWYHQYFGKNESPGLAAYALNNYRLWEDKISAWQDPILQCKSLPSWYKSALFNELYYISDGGTVWLEAEEKSDKQSHDSASADIIHSKMQSVIAKYGKFAYLEGHEYRMYNTYDVHHYASFALLMLWPNLQLSLQYDIAHCIKVEQADLVKYCMGGEWDAIKAADCVPHDIGDPDGSPWDRLNAYEIHPTQEWKDLNTKFILQVYRDYTHTQDMDYLRDMYPLCKLLIEKCLRWDTDDDGIIDNSGFADQTYDAWTVSGASAYCGGIWLAALYMFIKMADILGFKEDQHKFTKILEKGKMSYETKLWNGSYYNYDSSTSGHHDSIMADQLAGHWFLKASAVSNDQVFPKDHVTSALKAIFKHNVLPFDEGKLGAINGMRPSGVKDISSLQSEEFWTGVNYGLAATMIQEGMLEEGFQTAYGAYHTCWQKYGLAFQTPEAYFDDGRFRSLGYMRPLAIWAMQFALEKYHLDMLK